MGNAVKTAAAHGVNLMTVHAVGGRAMLEEAARAGWLRRRAVVVLLYCDIFYYAITFDNTSSMHCHPHLPGS